MDSPRIHRNLTNAPASVNCAKIVQAEAWLSWVVVYLRFVKSAVSPPI